MEQSAAWVGITNCLAFLWAALREAPVLAVAFLLFAILSGFGRGLGLPLLFWRATHGQPGEKARARFVVGFATGALLAVCCFVGCLSEVTLWPASPASFYRAYGISCLVAGACLLALSVPQLRQSAHDQVAGSVRTMSGGSLEVESVAPVGGNAGAWNAWHLPLGGMIGVGSLWGAVVFLTPRLPESLSSHTPTSWATAGIRVPHSNLVELASLHVMGAFLLAVGAVVYAALWFGNRYLGREMYPAAAVCLVLVVVVVVHGFLTMRVRAGTAAVLFIGLLGYAALNGRWQRARARGLHPTSASGRSSAAAEKALLSDAGALAGWRGLHGAKRPVLVVVAADGGGIRAAVWTASVLTRLEDRGSSFSTHVRLITGASGGMLGATYWAATLTPTGGHFDRAPLPASVLLDRVKTGALSAVASGLVFRDLWPPPLRRGHDRGTELELAWERNCPVLADTIGSLADGERAGWRPSVVLSPMVVEDGRRLVISNLDLGALLESAAAAVAGPAGLSQSGCQALEIWPWAAETLSLSTAIRLQANFPWVLPSTEIPPIVPGGPRCRVVDAGYYDETGVDLACAWIRRHFEFLRKETGGVVLLQIRDTSSIDRKEVPRAHRSPLARGMDGLLTPVAAILRARDATNWYRNDAAVADLSQRWQAAAGAGFFTTEIAEFGGEASLSWSLTEQEADDICEYGANPQVSDALNRVAARL